MKINPSFLLKMLAPMQVVIPKRHTLPIIECLKMDSTGFTGTNLEQTIHIPYKNLPEVCIDYRVFIDTLKTLGNRIVEMNLDSETFEITFSTGEMTMKMYGQNNESYPNIKEFIPGTKTTIPDLSGFLKFASKDAFRVNRIVYLLVRIFVALMLTE
jgi:DNA polymerase III sliding clamp (beta) subunit (PCNA family)